jgi:hypothetical protein
MMSHVKNTETALRFGKATQYPPSGSRGLSPFTRNHKYSDDQISKKMIEANANIFTGVLVEGAEGLGALEEISNLDNLDMIYFGIYDLVANIQPVTIKNTTGQVLIGTSTVGSGKLVVASSTGDNGVQIVSASAPSLRIDNAESGPTKRAGLGISTATNNFIQGSADRDFCIFNGSTTASPILFGIYDTTNVQEAARISTARNLLVGGTTDNGQKLQIFGTAYIQLNTGIGTITPFSQGTGARSTEIAGTNFGQLYVSANSAAIRGTFMARNGTNDIYMASITNANLILGTNDTGRLTIKSSGVLNIANIPTSSVGLSSGDIYSNLGVLTIVP